MSTAHPGGDAADLADGTPASHLEPPIGEGPIERLCKWASEAALITMLVVIGVDIFTRYVLNFSFEIADELGGYMLVVMTFVSLSVSGQQRVPSGRTRAGAALAARPCTFSCHL